jgi:hypothetical protein
MPRERVGGTRLVGRHYFLRDREVEVVTGWGPGATVRNVAVRFLDTQEMVVRPFRGLTREPRPGRRPRPGQHEARAPERLRGLRSGTGGG